MDLSAEGANYSCMRAGEMLQFKPKRITAGCPIHDDAVIVGGVARSITITPKLRLVSSMRILLISLIVLAAPLTALATPRIEVSSHATPREHYAAEHLRTVIAKLSGNERILLAVEHDPLFASFGKDVPELWPGAKEAFILKRLGNTIVVEGADPSGVLYGTEEFIDRIHVSARFQNNSISKTIHNYEFAAPSSACRSTRSPTRTPSTTTRTPQRFSVVL